MSPYPGSRLLTTRQVAELLAVAPETVLRRIRAGELSAIRLATNALRIRESELEAYLERSAYACQATVCVTSTTKGDTP